MLCAPPGLPVPVLLSAAPLPSDTHVSPSADAQNVLARGSHCVGGAELCVRPAPPWDPTRLLLGGSDPHPPPELLEHLLGRPRHSFELDPAPAPGWGLLRLRDPISARGGWVGWEHRGGEGSQSPLGALGWEVGGACCSWEHWDEEGRGGVPVPTGSTGIGVHGGLSTGMG